MTTSAPLMQSNWHCKECNSINNANYCTNCGLQAPIQTDGIASVPQIQAHAITDIQSTTIVPKPNLQESFIDLNTDNGNLHFVVHINKEKCLQYLKESCTYYMTLIFVCDIICSSMIA